MMVDPSKVRFGLNTNDENVDRINPKGKARLYAMAETIVQVLTIC